jgi:cytochrome c nitrite reductase small subunit
MRFSISVVIVLALGVAFGIGLFTFGYARGYSYLMDDPSACVNCHIMRPQYESWLKSSHHAVAGCNDCHTPADPIGKVATKALNGFNHSLAFTSGRFHEPIRANALNRKLAREACSKCHAAIADSLHALSREPKRDFSDCTRCHGSVGHPL